MSDKPTITQEDALYVDDLYTCKSSFKEVAIELAGALREERERHAAMIRAREEVEEYMREKAREKAKKPHDWAWGITEIALYAADLKARNAELERAVGKLREALKKATAMDACKSTNRKDTTVFLDIRDWAAFMGDAGSALASTAHLVAPEKEKK